MAMGLVHLYSSLDPSFSMGLGQGSDLQSKIWTQTYEDNESKFGFRSEY